MKIIGLLLISFLGSYSAAFAQRYVPFPTKNAVWKQYYEVFHEEPEPHGLSITKQYKIERDTVVKGKIYSLISLSERWINFDANKKGTLSKFTRTNIGAIREDSSKRIYFFDFKTGKDTLLYNFNQQIG